MEIAVNSELPLQLHPENIKLETIDSPFNADMVLVRIGDIDKKINDVNEIVDDELRYLKSWREEELNKLESEKIFHSQILEVWMLSNEKKSVSLPHGRVFFRKQPLKIKVIDEYKLLQSSYIRTKKEIDKKKLLEHFKRTGEIVDGCDIVSPDDKFYIKPKIKEERQYGKY